jgi:hypothetical protein
MMIREYGVVRIDVILRISRFIVSVRVLRRMPLIVPMYMTGPIGMIVLAHVACNLRM